MDRLNNNNSINHVGYIYLNTNEAFADFKSIVRFFDRHVQFVLPLSN